MSITDFSSLAISPKMYGGGNGKKISVRLDGERYMLKFPPPAKRNNDMSYSNGCFSEHIGSRIFESVGIPVQETRLGQFTMPTGEVKIVVACKDFTAPGVVLQDFAQLKNTVLDSGSNGFGTELESILEAINTQIFLDRRELTNRFWDMFIVDALIGNWDRHNGNWGLLYNELTEEVNLAPVFDCGSCLYPQADDAIMRKTLSSNAEMNLRIFEIPTSAIKIQNRKIRYFDFISSFQNKECSDALRRIVPRIDMNRVYEIVDETPFLSDLQRRFYRTMLKERKRRILDYSLSRLLAEDSQANKKASAADGA